MIIIVKHMYSCMVYWYTILSNFEIWDICFITIANKNKLKNKQKQERNNRIKLWQ